MHYRVPKKCVNNAQNSGSEPFVSSLANVSQCSLPDRPEFRSLNLLSMR